MAVSFLQMMDICRTTYQLMGNAAGLFHPWEDLRGPPLFQPHFSLHPPCRQEPSRAGPPHPAPARRHGLRGHSINHWWLHTTLHLHLPQMLQTEQFCIHSDVSLIILIKTNNIAGLWVSWEKWKGNTLAGLEVADHGSQCHCPPQPDHTMPDQSTAGTCRL